MLSSLVRALSPLGGSDYRGHLEHAHKFTHATTQREWRGMREAEGSWPSVLVGYSRKGMVLGKVQSLAGNGEILGGGGA